MRASIRRPRSGATALDRLAVRCGIEPGFQDARGEYIRTRSETQIRLLDSMGVRVESEREASSALAEIERAAWQFCLPPATVARDEDRVCTVEAVLPAGTRILQWHAQLEDGAERDGNLAVAALDLVGRDARTGSEKRRLHLRDLPHGYHRLQLPELRVETALIVTPQSCWLPDGLRNGPGLWGDRCAAPVAALGAQLGHRRFRRPRRAGANRRHAGVRRDRRQPAAPDVSRRAGTGQPLFAG
jgi:MalQ N-terminal beta sandwich domain